mmetsp:Transcript_159523/g.306177  ORF Transcript_159523/g.306177 Transcript_159523/m.306177 type:complete len:413 (+) Transcript_159523:62-1300(+)
MLGPNGRREAEESWHVAAKEEANRAEVARAMKIQAAHKAMRATNPEDSRKVMWQTVSVSNFFRRKRAPKDGMTSLRNTGNRWLDHALFARDPAGGTGVVQVSDEMLTAAFDEMDRYGRRKINLHQLVKAMRKCKLNVSRPAIRRVFRDMDMDPDKPLSVEDFIRFFRHAERLTARAEGEQTKLACCSKTATFCLFANLVVLCVFVMLLLHADESQDPLGYGLKQILTIVFAAIVFLFICMRVIVPLCTISAPTVQAGVTTVATQVRHVMPAQSDKSAVPENIDWESPPEQQSRKEKCLDNSCTSPFDALSYRNQALQTTAADPGAPLWEDDASFLRAVANMQEDAGHSAEPASVVCQAARRENGLQQYDPQAYAAAAHAQYSRREVVPVSFNAFSVHRTSPAVVVAAPSFRR